MITLKNERITLSIAETGAEMRRMTLDGKDVLWSGDPAVWSGVAPLMFPFCGGTPHDEYSYKGVTYPMEKHGFARFRDFAVEDAGDSFATFVQTSSDETKKKYPWDYTLRINYRLHGRQVDITYTVTNDSDSTMLFAIGSHEAYACPEGIEDYDIVFEKPETLFAYPLTGNLLERTPVQMLKDARVFPLYDKYFAVDALVFKDLHSREATLRHRATGRAVTVRFDTDYFLLWHKHGAPYMCMEPWGGIPSFVDEPQTLETREGMTRLAAGETFVRTHSILL